MVEEVLQEPEQQQEPTQQDPPKKRLWSKLSGSKLYTKSYEDFEKQFSTPESIDRLYVVLNKKQLYTKTKGEFINQFFSQPSKKKVGTIDFANSSLSIGEDLSHSHQGEIPLVSDYGNGDLIPNNSVDLSRKAVEYSKKTKEIEQTDLRGNINRLNWLKRLLLRT